MEWIERLNIAVNYIEEHLKSEIDYDEAARIACCSTYHFQRMFSYIAGVPLAEYIRRRRLSMAAVDLQNSNWKIIDIALKYGYDSPTAFSRAFQTLHGMSPSNARAEGVTVKAYPKISFQISIKGDVEMNYRIENKEAFRVMGTSQALTKDIEENFKIVPQMWGKASMDGTIPKLVNVMDTEIKGIMGVSVCNTNDNWSYYICAASTQPVLEGWDEYTVPAFTWAIFSGEGAMPDSIQELEKRIVTEWLPTSGYEYADGPDIELYLSPDPTKAVFEVWLPVVKK